MKTGLIIIARRKLELPEERFNKRKKGRFFSGFLVVAVS
jgi:hypothetical protein